VRAEEEDERAPSITTSLSIRSGGERCGAIVRRRWTRRRRLSPTEFASIGTTWCLGTDLEVLGRAERPARAAVRLDDQGEGKRERGERE
jgi:hypothetical protein